MTTFVLVPGAWFGGWMGGRWPVLAQPDQLADALVAPAHARG
jgi:hypothetical protein